MGGKRRGSFPLSPNHPTTPPRSLRVRGQSSRWIEQGRGRAYVADRLKHRVKRYQPKRAHLPEAKGWGVLVPVLEHLRSEPVHDREDRAQLFTMMQEIAHLRPLFYALLVRAAWEEWGRTDRKRFHIFVRRILRDFPRIEQEEGVARLAYGDLRLEPERVGGLKLRLPVLEGPNLESEGFWCSRDLATRLGPFRYVGCPQVGSVAFCWWSRLFKQKKKGGIPPQKN